MARKKRCRECGVDKNLSEFYQNKQQDRPNQASHRPECKACNKQRRVSKPRPTYMQEFK